jgi:opacity protein-like surface antigen
MNLKQFFCVTLLLSAFGAQAYSDCDDAPAYYLQAQGGMSYTRCTKISADQSFWDPAAEGYDAKLCKAPVVGIAFGYLVNNWLAVGVSVDHRSIFKYRKFQTTPSTALTTPNFLGNKTRLFDLDNSSFMVDFTINKLHDGCLYDFDCDYFKIAPYLGFGLGLSKNTIYNFHSVQQDTLTADNFTTNIVHSIMSPVSQNKLGWKFQLGLDMSACGCFYVGIGYRFFDGGKFRTNNYIIDSGSSFAAPIKTPAWCGKLRAHEVFGTISLAF